MIRLFSERIVLRIMGLFLAALLSANALNSIVNWRLAPEAHPPAVGARPGHLLNQMDGTAGTTGNHDPTLAISSVQQITQQEERTVAGRQLMRGEVGWTNFFEAQLLKSALWGYVLLALLVAVEGPIATLVGAGAAATGVLDWPWVFVAASLGNLSADTFWYWIGRSGRLSSVARYGRWVGLQPEQIFRLSRRLRQNTVKVLFVAKITAGLVIPTLIAAGLIRAPWRKWFPPIFLGETLWTGTLVFVGYHATSLLFQVEQTVRYFIVGGSLIFLVVIIFVVRQTLRRSKKVEPQ